MKAEINQSGVGPGEIVLCGLWYVLKVQYAVCWEESHVAQRGPQAEAILTQPIG